MSTTVGRPERERMMAVRSEIQEAREVLAAARKEVEAAREAALARDVSGDKLVGTPEFKRAQRATDDLKAAEDKMAALRDAEHGLLVLFGGQPHSQSPKGTSTSSAPVGD